MHLVIHVNYIAYIDEFGHIGPYIDRSDPKHNDSPVFGLAGFVLPIEQVREFGTWFFQQKCNLLAFEIAQSDVHPAHWEKKGSSLYTAKNIAKYRQLRHFTNRLLNKIEAMDGFVVHVGVQKTKAVGTHKPNTLYRAVFRELLKRMDQFCEHDCQDDSNIMLVMDEHEQRSELITEASKSMYNTASPRRSIIEPPFQVESHRYQTLQAADWLAAIVGRLGAYWADPEAYPENEKIRHYFETRLLKVSKRSGIRTDKRA